jgi:hypothetical protein
MPIRIALITCVASLLASGSVACGSSIPEAVPTNWPSASASSPSQETVSVPEKELNFVRAAQSAGTDEVEGADDLSVLNQGRELCGLPDRTEDGGVSTAEPDVISGDGEPPTLDGLIEDPPGKFGKLAIKMLCPKYLPMLQKAAGGFGEGDMTVGEDVKPGTYRTTGSAHDCFWERSTGGGRTIANDFVSNAPKGVTVTIYASDGGFKSNNCGDWIRVR